jgi:Na+/H+-dicarboxylate symporter
MGPPTDSAAVPASVLPHRRWSLSTKVTIGLLSGVALGLLIGERAAVLDIVGDGYVKMLQMTVLPYITVSLVGGLGSLSLTDAKRLGGRFTVALLALWCIALVVVFVFPLTFPATESASFFSTTLLEESRPLDLIGLYVPTNPFNSLANNIVPAVVLFSVLLGLALIAVPNRRPALDVIRVFNDAVGRVARFVVSLTPYGLFAIAAVIAGTFDPIEAAQLQIYLFGYALLSLLLALWILPGLIAALTPIPYRAVLRHTRDTLVMAFTTGSLFAVLSMLTEHAKDLLRLHTTIGQEDESLPDIVIPASFNFPHTAKLLSLSFILFAAWFTGASLPSSKYPALAAAGVFVLFGNLNVAVPYLLDMFRIPADSYQLFLATGVVNSRFGTMLSAVHTLTMAVLVTCAVTGTLRLHAQKLARFVLITAALLVSTVMVSRAAASRFASRSYDRDTVLMNMETIHEHDEGRDLDASTPLLPPLTGSVLDRIRDRQALRVGYLEDSLPYVFRNQRHELVGFDVEMAYRLAHDLGVTAEFVPIDRRVFETGLDPSTCDLVMSGTAVTTGRSLRVTFSAPYVDETLAFVVPDYRRGEFVSWDEVRQLGAIRIAVPDVDYYVNKVRAELPTAQIVTVARAETMFGSDAPAADAFVLTAERGSAYTLLHPEYSVVVPKPGLVKVPLAYVIAGRDQALTALVSEWIDLKRKDGTVDDLFAHWILGRNATPHRRRWNVLDDVLHVSK